MSSLVNPVRIEVVRGAVTDVRAEQILQFWARHGVPINEEARRRLAEVVCVRLDSDGVVNGINSVSAGTAEHLGGQQLWIYRSRLPSAGAGESADADPMLAAAYAALNAAYDPDVAGPKGLCALLTPAQVARRPQAQWQDPPMLHAGFAANGRQIRLAWFTGATIDAEATHG